MTITITDPWIERQITAGHLSPGARGLTRNDAVHQYNQANALTPNDADFIHTPGQAQTIVHELLALIGIVVDPTTRIMLTDATVGPWCGAHCVNVGQLEFAIEQDHRVRSPFDADGAGRDGRRYLGARARRARAAGSPDERFFQVC